ncbi:MAG: Gfo/Idh/MocA family oxidoreductase [Planctomycetes bacterium]|nr:Gfo/Idh/MocA family oxidoreductase [Planctomycetota bacterium]
MDKVRIGVIGCGVMGPRHVESAVNVQRAEPLAVADLIASKAAATAEKFGVPRVYRSGDELLDDPDVDAVVLAFPAATRTAMALKAFARGKHVLTEKPVASTAGDVRRMIAAKGDLVAGCCSLRFLYHEHAQVAAAFLADRPLGDLRLVRARQLVPGRGKPATLPPAWRLRRDLNGGGILYNWGCYDLDYLLGLTGWTLRPRTVFAQAWPIPQRFADQVAPESDAETYYTALVRCESGTILSLERGEYMPAAADAAWQIIGEHGSLRLMMTPGEGKQLIHDEATADGVVAHVLWTGDEGWHGPHTDAPLRDFVDAICDGRPPQTDLARSLVIQEITDAIIASAASGRCVEIGT